MMKDFKHLMNLFVGMTAWLLSCVAVEAEQPGSVDSMNSVIPWIQVSYPECSSEESRVKYYRPLSGETEEVIFMTFLGSTPEIQIYKNDIEVTDNSSYINWGETMDGQITATVSFPYELEQGEAKYQILAICQEYFENDVYESDLLVLDSKAPELKAYEIVGDAENMIGQVPVYHNKGETEDVTITFTVEDHADYWEPGNFQFSIIDTEDNNRAVVNITGDNIDWSKSCGNLQKGNYTFDGEPEKASAYVVRISYADKAGNVLTMNPAELSGTGSLEQGVYMSTPFILDHVFPVLTVHCTAPVQTEDSVGYYADSFEVIFEIQERYAVLIADSVVTKGLEDCILELYKDGSLIDLPEIIWTKNDDIYRGVFYIKKDAEKHSTDGAYHFRIEYQDAADNMVSYNSSSFVMDTVAPEIKVSYKTVQEDGVPKNMLDGRCYYDQAVKMIVQVKEANGRYQELWEELKSAVVEDMSGTSITGSFQESVDDIDKKSRTDGEGTVWEFDLSTEAVYTIPLGFTDLAGNQICCESEMVTVDMTDPVLEVTCETEELGFLEEVNYKEDGYIFSDGKITVKIKAKDQISGISGIICTIMDEDGDMTTYKKEFTPMKEAVYETEIPVETEAFKGKILAEVYDVSLNQTVQKRGYIVESREQHAKSGSAVIDTKTRPSRTVGGEAYYNSDVEFELTFQDTYSGLRKWSYTGGSTLSDSEDYAALAGDDLSETPNSDIVFTYSKNLILSADSNNENGVSVSAEYMDHAGHAGKVEKTYNIDVTPPEVTVEYDLKKPINLRFFDQPRTAKVTIRERNFHEDDVEFLISNTKDTMPHVSDWEVSGDGDDRIHVCYVTFYADGDYTFSVEFQDMAGNKADYDRVDEFTIDQTVPVVTVTYDHNQSRNELYYAQSRTATIDILEHNFDPAFIDVQITAAGTVVPAVYGWLRKGDHNIATVTFDADAEYTFDILGTDQAGNALDEYIMDRFVVDQTAPELEIHGVEHMSANNGEVRPEIRCFDTNFDEEGMRVRITGFQNGKMECPGITQMRENGFVLTLDDFEQVPEMDDLYTIEAVVSDLAGNQSETSVLFSVNRFGSVYTFDETTEAIMNAYYTDQEQALMIMETNVDSLEFHEITCNLNGKLRTLKAGKDYTLEVTGSDRSWKQYLYKIHKENFSEEGVYILTIYSEDKASNISNNQTKGKRIEFAVDKTSPSIVVSGVEADGRYRERSREIMLDVQDNVVLEAVEVQIDDTKMIYSGEELAERNGRIVLTAGSEEYWQTLKVSARDAAGNVYTHENISFLVTPNVFVQFIMNKTVFYGVIASLLFLAVGIIMTMYILVKKDTTCRRKQ